MSFFRIQLQNSKRNRKFDIHEFFYTVHHPAHPIQPMKMIYGDHQHQTHWKQLLPKNRNHENVNQDHPSHRHASRANSGVVRIIRLQQRVHSMKDVLCPKHVKKRNSAVAKMVFQQLKARKTRDARHHCVRAVCSDAAHLMAKRKHKESTTKVKSNSFRCQ